MIVGCKGGNDGGCDGGYDGGCKLAVMWDLRKKEESSKNV